MADLAKTRKPVSARQRGTRNRDTILPSRRDTRAPSLEVNAPIVGPNQSKARKLAEILGVAEQAGEGLVNVARERDAGKREGIRAEALADAQAGREAMSDSEVYARTYFGYKAQEDGIKAASAAVERVEALLNDPDQKPTVADVMGIMDGAFKEFAQDPDGGLRYEGIPSAQRAMAAIMGDTRAKVLAQAIGRIKDRQDTELFRAAASATLYEIINAPSGTPNAANSIVEIDPGASVVAAATPGKKPSKATPIEATGRLPVRGTITSTYAQHRERGSKGLDIDGRIGDPVQAPASGKVIKRGMDPKSGRYMVISHGKDAEGREIVSTYSHLSEWVLEEGDAVPAGATIAKVGNTGNVRSRTGDGSHLHYRVKVGGKDVDPAAYSFSGASSAAAIEGVDPIDIQWAEAMARGETPKVNVEAYFKGLPPTVDKKKAKEFLQEYLVNEADKMNRPELLEAAALSEREDGTPSFTPAEQVKLREQASAIRRSKRAERRAAENELHQENTDKLHTAIVNGQEPSQSSIRDAVNKGLLPPQIGLWYENYQDQQENQDRIERDRAEAEEEARTEASFDSMAAAEAARLANGLPPKYDADELLRMFESGELGTDEYGNPSKGALSRYSTLLRGINESAKVRAESPQGAAAAALLDSRYYASGTSASGDPLSGVGLLGGTKSGKPLDPAIHANMMGKFNDALKAGKTPREAFDIADDYASKHVKTATVPLTQRPDSDLAAREAELARKAAGR